MKTKDSIDFTNHIPYYLQLIDVIKEKIASKEWPEGSQIPGEQDLCEIYSVSRTVVRQALRELDLEGIIDRRKGKGTFVAKPKISEGLVQNLTGFYQDMTERGLKPITQVLLHEIIPASEKVAAQLAIAPGSQVIHLRRLRFINDEPIQLVTSYLPYDVCPQVAEVDFTNRSLYEYLEKECGFTLGRARRSIEAVAAKDAEARLLQIERGTPLLMLTSVSYTTDGIAIEYFHALHRGDRSRFDVDLVLAHASQPNPDGIGASFSNAPAMQA